MISKERPQEGLAFFLYRSSAVEGLGRGELGDIVAVARARNLAEDLTGCMHFEDGLFFQWLEGNAPRLWPVVEAICRDPRHHDMMILGQGGLAARYFPAWQMHYSDRRDGCITDWFASRSLCTRDPAIYSRAIRDFLSSIAG